MTHVILTEADRAALRRSSPRLQVRDIANAVAAEAALPVDAIFGPRRDAEVAGARQIVMFIAWRRGFKLEAIGCALDRDHTTVLHGIRAEAKRRGLSMEALRRERSGEGQGQDDTGIH